VSVEFRPMRNEELAVWLPLMRDRYAEDMIGHAALPPERARSKAVDDVERLFPGGEPSPDQLVFVIEADGEPVGNLWLADRDDSFQRAVFVYDIRVDESQRGKGYGRAAMVFAATTASRSTSSAGTRSRGASTARSATTRTPSR
jgi:GNAT superfamily N-acetyltransferase